MFSALNQGSIIYILDKTERPKFKVGEIISISQPKVDYNSTGQFGQYQATTVDIKVNIDGNTYGHLFIIFRQHLPPINLINSLRNNNGLNMAQLYNICVSIMVPKILLPRLQTIKFECPICYITKTHKCPCLSCKHQICLDCWLRCKNCPICRTAQ